jgi:hypothetical protein
MDGVKIQRLSDGDSVKLFYTGDRDPIHNRYSISWHLPNGGNPGANGDYIGLWQSDGDGDIMPSVLIKSYPINSAISNGNIIVEADIGLGEYVFGYSQCGQPPASTSPMVSATLSIPAGKFDLSKVVSSNTSMQLQQADFSLAIDVAYPPNFDPVAGTWIGIFEAGPHITATNVLDGGIKYKASCEDIIAHKSSKLLSLIINDFSSMVRDTEYVIGFFVNGWNKDKKTIKLNALATWLRFST